MKKIKIYILVDKRSARLDYVIDVIFKIHLGLAYQIVTIFQDLPSNANVINYSNSIILTPHISIVVHPILQEDTIYTQEIVVNKSTKGLHFFFASDDFEGSYKFDLFAMVFYQISRYEEYLSFIPDLHGRFAAKQSLAYEEDFLENPIVDRWILDLRSRIEDMWKVKIILPRSFKIVPTIDIDSPYAFIHKSWYVHLGAVARDLFLFRYKRLKDRTKSLLKMEEDPFNTYDFLTEELTPHNSSVLFFFLMNLNIPDDLNFSIDTDAFTRLVKRLSQKYNTGIHPSLQSKLNFNKIKSEKVHLEKLSGLKMTRSRQHFLSLSFPNTYQLLLELGITEDHSMAFHDLSGFRASTSVPYPAFDLKHNKGMDLMIHPVVTMDVTLRDRHNYDSDEAKAYIALLKSIVQSVEGQFEFIWHNSSFSELYGWKGWHKVFKSCLEPNKSSD